MIIKKTTIQLLRIPFSVFLLPVFLFGLSQPLQTNWGNAFLLFFILHLLVYPASNGYNSFIDRDQSPIGGLEHPPLPERELYFLTLLMDVLAIGLSFFISIWTMLAICFYIIASRAYSSRVTRLKKYPLLGWLVVSGFQGGLIFWVSFHGTHQLNSTQVPLSGVLASCLLLAGAYPLTQVYQHAQDAADGITTISMRVGIKGTFLLSGLLYFLAFLFLGVHFGLQLELNRFLLLLVFFIPVLIYFTRWTVSVWRNPANADFQHLMKMNWLSAICSIAGFGSLVIWKFFD